MQVRGGSWYRQGKVCNRWWGRKWDLGTLTWWRSPTGEAAGQRMVLPPHSPRGRVLHPSRMERSGLESQVGPGAAGVERTRCVLWIRGKVWYSGGQSVPGGGQVLEFENGLGLHSEAVKSLRSDLCAFTYVMDKFETHDLLLHQQVQTFTALPPPHRNLWKRHPGDDSVGGHAACTAGQASARVKPGPGRNMRLCLLNSKYLQSNSSCLSFSEATTATHCLQGQIQPGRHGVQGCWSLQEEWGKPCSLTDEAVEVWRHMCLRPSFLFNAIALSTPMLPKKNSQESCKSTASDSGSLGGAWEWAFPVSSHGMLTLLVHGPYL